MLSRINRLLDQAFATAGSTTEAGHKHALRLATAALMVEISRADSVLEASERTAMIEGLGRRFDLSREETEELLSGAETEVEEAVSLHQFTRRLNERLSRQEKREVIGLLWQVALADGRIDKYEEYTIRKVAELLHLPHRDYIRTKLAVTGD